MLTSNLDPYDGKPVRYLLTRETADKLNRTTHGTYTHSDRSCPANPNTNIDVTNAAFPVRRRFLWKSATVLEHGRTNRRISMGLQKEIHLLFGADE